MFLRRVLDAFRRIPPAQLDVPAPTPVVAHDLRLHSGERQVAVRYEDIRADHRNRYEWVARRLPENGFGADVFCGNGYGTHLLARHRHLIGIDGSPAAIAIAQEYYRGATALFACNYWPFSLPPEVFNFVVALESIEHVPDSERLLEVLVASICPGGDLIFSVPCEDYLPFRKEIHPFHYRHFRHAEITGLIASQGLELIGFAGQSPYILEADGRQMLVPETEQFLRDGEAGQFVIVHCRKPHRDIHSA